MNMFLITLFLGYLGVHRFMRGQTGLGLLYLFTFGLFGIGWLVDSVLAFANIKNSKQNNRQIQNDILAFQVRSWEEYLDNISEWQKANARDQWVNAKYSSKKLYQYSWMTTNDIKLIPEPKNEHDKYAIGVHLGQYKIGYIPKPVNEQYYRQLIKDGEIKADIHGGNSKCIDAYGDLIVDKQNPVVEITILI